MYRAETRRRLSAIRGARDIAYIDYAGDALAGHHLRQGNDLTELRRDLACVARWRKENDVDVAAVIRRVRLEGRG